MLKKVVLITGCSSGIGLATSVFLAQKGYQVVATMRDLNKRTAFDRALKESSVVAELLPLDVTDKQSIATTLEQIQAKFGRLDGLINNAGITIDGFFEDLNEADVRKLFEVNFFGVLEITRQVLPMMRQQKSGHVITIGSIAGQYALPQIGVYSAAKFALEGWTEALRYEVAPFNVKVSIVEPCFIRTEMVQSNRMVGYSSNSILSPYTIFNHAFEQFYEDYDEKYSKEPVEVAQLIYRILTANQPKIRYMLGGREKLFYLSKRLLPQVLFEKLYNHSFPKMILKEED